MIPKTTILTAWVPIFFVKWLESQAYTSRQPSGASWVHGLDKLDDSTIKDNDNHYRRRLQALQAVDDLVEKTIQRLEYHNMLDNTYIIYTSDNGFHISQHRLTPGKRCPYEEDVRYTSHVDFLEPMRG